MLSGGIFNWLYVELICYEGFGYENRMLIEIFFVFNEVVYGF